jgi:hypothetical protein
MAHYKSIHKNELIDDDNMTLLDMGFSSGPHVASDSTNALAIGPNEAQSRNTSPTRGPTIAQPLPFGPVTLLFLLPLKGNLIKTGNSFGDCVGNMLIQSSRRIQQQR